jgi:hypothetical protein
MMIRPPGFSERTADPLLAMSSQITAAGEIYGALDNKDRPLFSPL